MTFRTIVNGITITTLTATMTFGVIGQTRAAVSTPHYVTDPASCPRSDDQFPGQSCPFGQVICGVNGDDVPQCTTPGSISAPGSSATSNTQYTSSIGGGFIIDCFAQPLDSAAPFCDNNGSALCNRDASCYSTKFRDTTCTAGSFGAFTCGGCRSGYQDCNTASDVCEVQTGVTNYDNNGAGPTEANTNYGASCSAACDSGYLDCNSDLGSGGNGCEIQVGGSCGGGSSNAVYGGACNGSEGSCGCSSGFLDCNSDLTINSGQCEIQIGGSCGANAVYGASCNGSEGSCSCSANFFDCDASGPGSGNGCEVETNTACTTADGASGTYNGCTCVPTKSYFETGTQSVYSTTGALLQGKNLGTGALIEMLNNNGGGFTVFNSGALQIGNFIQGSGTGAGTLRWTGTDFEGFDGTNWNSLTSGGGGGGSAVIQEGDSTVVQTGSTLDFNASDFTITEGPANEANISIDTTNLDNRYVNTSGGTMTGDLILSNGAALSLSGALRTEGNLTINQDNGAVDAILTFGNAVLAETLRFSHANNRFEFSDDVHVEGTLTASGKLIIEDSATFGSGVSITGDATVTGTLSGASIHAGSQFSGAGLTSCNGANQKLLWNSTTQQFECGTDVDTDTDTDTDTHFSGTGALQSAFDDRYINQSGDTMTGDLVIADGAALSVSGAIITEGNLTINQDNGAVDAILTFGNDAAAETLRFSDTTNGFIFSDDLEVQGVLSGATIHAQDGLTSSGSLNVEGDANIHGTLSGNTISGFNLTDCDNATTSKLLWDATTQRFVCGTDTDTDTNTDNQNLFQDIAVSGQNTISADSATDTLTIAEGSNVTITTNDSTDTITINATDTNTTYDAGQGITINGTTIRVNSTLTGTTLEFQTITGATVHAQSKLTTSGSLVVEEGQTVTFNGVTYTFPSSDGTNGQVLTTDGAGSLSWQDDDGGGGGLSQNAADDRYVNQSGDTMTGDLVIANGAALSVSGAIITEGNLTINQDNGAVDAILTFGNDLAAETLRFSDTTNGFIFSDDLEVQGTLSGSTLRILSGAIIESGNVGIGTTNPDGRLSVYADVTSVVSGWYNASWNKRKTITIANTQVSGSSDHSNFPVLISLTTDSDLAADAQNDGDDIVFTTSAGAKLDHEIERFDGATGELVAWVQVPTLSYNTDTVLHMYYDNSSASNQENATGVWDDGNYVSVWHMAEDPSVSTDGDCGGGTDEFCDSTSNNNDGDSLGSMTTGDLVNAQMGKGIDFDGTDDRMIAPGTFSSTNTMTISAWFSADTLASYRSVVGMSDGAPEMILSRASGTPLAYAWEDKSDESDAASGLSVPTTGEMVFGAVVITPTAATVYLNTDSSQSSWTNTKAHSTKSGGSGDIWRIGRRRDIGSNDWDGIIDEVRVETTSRSADWLTTRWNNENNPSGFIALGSEENQTNTTNSVPVLTVSDNAIAVGIGTTSPSEELEVVGTASGRALHAQDRLTTSGSLVIDEGGTLSVNGNEYNFPEAQGPSSGAVLRTDTSGNLSWGLIGTGSLQLRKKTLTVSLRDATVVTDGSHNEMNVYAGTQTGSTSNIHHYLRAETGSGVLQDIDIRLKVRLPQDFVNFSSESNDLRFSYRTVTNSPLTSKLDILVEDADGNPAFTASDGQGLNNTSWTDYTDEFDDVSFSPEAGEYLYITVKTYASENAAAYAGKVELTYTGR